MRAKAPPGSASLGAPSPRKRGEENGDRDKSLRPASGEKAAAAG